MAVSVDSMSNGNGEFVRPTSEQLPGSGEGGYLSGMQSPFTQLFSEQIIRSREAMRMGGHDITQRHEHNLFAGAGMALLSLYPHRYSGGSAPWNEGLKTGAEASDLVDYSRKSYFPSSRQPVHLQHRGRPEAGFQTVNSIVAGGEDGMGQSMEGHGARGDRIRNDAEGRRALDRQRRGTGN